VTRYYFRDLEDGTLYSAAGELSFSVHRELMIQLGMGPERLRPLGTAEAMALMQGFVARKAPP
jgi:hypothetical protein